MSYDILVAGILLFAVIRGAMKGFVWQVATIAALVMCFGFSGSLSLAIAPYITLKPPLNRWVAMFGLYILFSFVAFAMARGLKNWIERMQFVEYDRHLGSVFGLIKGVIFVLVMTFFSLTLTQQMPELRDAVFHSQTGKASAFVMDRLHVVMPDELHDVLEPYIHTLDRPGLDLQAHGDDEDHAHGAGHSHLGEAPPPIEAPPFANEPGGTSIELPPFGDLIGRGTELPSLPDIPDFFNPAPSPPSSSPLPSSNPIRPANGTSQNLRAERDRRLREVASVLADSPTAQQTLVDEIEKSLSGLPDEIKLGVVLDLYTDLLVYDRNADPVPETDLSTRFDTRILRQLQLRNVPLSSLNTALQDRLRNLR